MIKNILAVVLTLMVVFGLALTGHATTPVQKGGQPLPGSDGRQVRSLGTAR